MPRLFCLLVGLLLSCVLAGCGADDGGGDGPEIDGDAADLEGGGAGTVAFPGTESGAKALLAQFLESDADTEALSASLRPAAEDYAAAFVGDAAAKAASGFKASWDRGRIHLQPKSGQSALLIWGASSEDLQGGKGHANEFPGGYRSITQHLQPGLTWYRFKFVKPGETSGMAWDGLVHVNGRWAIFPKPWRVLR